MFFMKVLDLVTLRIVNLTRPRPPSKISIKAHGMNKNGIPVSMNATAISKPIDLDPASPIRILLGEQLNQR